MKVTGQGSGVQNEKRRKAVPGINGVFMPACVLSPDQLFEIP